MTTQASIARGSAVAWMALGVAMSMFTAGAQYQTAPNSTPLDPISFRGPDPSTRFKEIIIDQKLEAQIPLDLQFINEAGQTVRLGDYFGDKPVVLSLVYYQCPALCNLVLNGMVAGFDGSPNTLDIGDDYQVVTVSIDPTEGPEVAGQKKASYMEQYHRDGGAEGWHFLTGQQDAIEDLAQSVGFRYYYDAETKQYAHASGIMFLTPGGKVSSYLMGIEYLPQQMKMAVLQAGEGKIGSLVEKLAMLCYAYDPARGAYGFYIMGAVRLLGGLTVGAILLFWVVSYVIGQRNRAQLNRPIHGGLG